MYRFAAATLALALLTACGADGPPVPPSKADHENGIRLSGDARMGIAYNSEG